MTTVPGGGGGGHLTTGSPDVVQNPGNPYMGDILRLNSPRRRVLSSFTDSRLKLVSDRANNLEAVRSYRSLTLAQTCTAPRVGVEMLDAAALWCSILLCDREPP